MSEKSVKLKANYKTNEIIEDQNCDHLMDTNKEIKSNLKTLKDTKEDTNKEESIDHLVDNKSDTNGVNECKVCNNEDLSTQFFASGPFYAIDTTVEQMARNADNTSDQRNRSDKCNVLYAEMPHIFGDDIQLNQSTDIKISDTNCNNSSQKTNGLDRHLVENYQLFCYNCCSSLTMDEESHLNHNLYYISSDESNTRKQSIDTNNSHSSVSSPLMLKFCKENGDQLDLKSLKDENICCNSSKNQSNYTTVIKPKAVRPQFGCIGSSGQSDTHVIHSTLPTLSFHGSTTVMTDSDESAFTQIPRRRSNSEATHHYHSISDDSNRMPLMATENRPQRHQRSKSVSKASNNWNNSYGLTKYHAISDKQLTQNESNNRHYFSLKTNLDENTKKVSNNITEPIHMTLEDVKHIFTKNQSKRMKNTKHKRNSNDSEDRNKSRSKSKIKCAIESLFKNKRKSDSPLQINDRNYAEIEENEKTFIKDYEQTIDANQCPSDNMSPFTHRALPPLPNNESKPIEKVSETITKEEEDERQKFLDYAASIERVKDCGWYWGPISGEMAEKLLASEPCGSFIVRDSSDEHYIFSLTFKLNGMVRHVRIEHDQGNFSFGSLQKFKSNTIVDFIENAIQHSRSGRFLFFLHRRPIMGPMRVQLLHPVSRFKQIQSLQHMCRFVILKHVRRDLIQSLPLPQMLKQYLNTPYYYSEELALMNKDEQKPSLELNSRVLSLNTSHPNMENN